MKNTILSALGLFVGVACNTATPEPEASMSARATAAIRALGERDGSAVAQCQRAVDACNAKVPDAAGGEVCARFVERCDALQERLSELRGPAEGCWRAVDACERAPEQAQCPGDLSLCEALDREASGDRDKTLECEARVQACLVRAQDLPEPALGACENMAAACDRVAENRAQAGRDDAGADPGDDDSDDGDDSDDDDASDGGAEDNDDDDVAKPRRARPNDGRGRHRDADAGAATDD